MICDTVCLENEEPSIHPPPPPELLEDSFARCAGASGMSAEGIYPRLKTAGMGSHNISL